MLRCSQRLSTRIYRSCSCPRKDLTLNVNAAYAINRRRFSYAVVDHAESYKQAMEGRHGEQLNLAYHEVKVKPHPPIGFDIEYDDEEEEDEFGFEEEEEEEVIEAENSELVDIDNDTADEEIVEELVDKDNDVDSNGVSYDNRGFPILDPITERAFKAGAPAGGSFAIIQMGGTQHKVCVDDVIVSAKLLPVKDWSVGAEIVLNEEDVLLLGSSSKTLVGLPFVNGAKVRVRVEELTRDAKVIVFKKRRRKNSRRKNGFRREVTLIRVLSIEFPNDK